jgi:hypothetical protein
VNTAFIATSFNVQGDKLMKAILITVLAVILVGCQGIKQAASQPAPGAMATGGWEFILQKSGTQNLYVESNIVSTSTPGTYNDMDGSSSLFTLDSSAYFADPAAGGGYQFRGKSSSFTLTVDAQLEVSGILNQSGGSTIRFTGTVGSSGAIMSGTFDDGSGNTAPFTASATQGLGGFYDDATDAIAESISGDVITETSQYGSGDYELTPSVGNFATLSSDIPKGGNGSVVFWNNSGVCSGNQCAVWSDISTRTLWVLMNNPTSGTNKVVGVLAPPA